MRNRSWAAADLRLQADAGGVPIAWAAMWLEVRSNPAPAVLIKGRVSRARCGGYGVSAVRMGSTVRGSRPGVLDVNKLFRQADTCVAFDKFELVERVEGCAGVQGHAWEMCRRGARAEPGRWPVNKAAVNNCLSELLNC